MLKASLQPADVTTATNTNHPRGTTSLVPELHKLQHGLPSNQMVWDCIIHQAAIEEHLADASSPSQKFPKRRRQGRLATISSPAPPVYVRPQGAEAPQAVGGHDDLPPDDDASLAERRHQWLQVDPEIRKLLRTLHVNFGHPTSTTMQRILRRQSRKSSKPLDFWPVTPVESRSGRNVPSL